MVMVMDTDMVAVLDRLRVRVSQLAQGIKAYALQRACGCWEGEGAGTRTVGCRC